MSVHASDPSVFVLKEYYSARHVSYGFQNMSAHKKLLYK
jgi:hypothetical protein